MNHCLRITAITNLKCKKWGNKHVKAVSGHKSDSSLEIYKKVSNENNIKMGMDLSQILTTQQNQFALPPPQAQLALPPPALVQQSVSAIMPAPSTINQNQLLQIPQPQLQQINKPQ